METMNCKKMKRREFLKLLSSSALLILGSGCKSKQVARKAEVLDLGEPLALLDFVQLIPGKGVAVFRDDRGWFTLSARCPVDECDLTLQEESLLCPCCRSAFDFVGRVVVGKASSGLPWYEMAEANGHLYANTGRIVAPGYRFRAAGVESEVAEARKESGFKRSKQKPKFQRP